MAPSAAPSTGNGLAVECIRRRGKGVHLVNHHLQGCGLIGTRTVGDQAHAERTRGGRDIEHGVIGPGLHHGFSHARSGDGPRLVATQAHLGGVDEAHGVAQANAVDLRLHLWLIVAGVALKNVLRFRRSNGHRPRHGLRTEYLGHQVIGEVTGTGIDTRVTPTD